MINELEAIRLKNLSLSLRSAINFAVLDEDIEYLSKIISDCDDKVHKYEISSRNIVHYTKTEMGKFRSSAKVILRSYFNLGDISYDFANEIDWEKDEKEFDRRWEACVDRNNLVNEERKRLYEIVDKTDFSEQLIIAKILLGRKSQYNERNCLESALADSIRTEIITEFLNKNSNYKPNKTTE